MAGSAIVAVPSRSGNSFLRFSQYASPSCNAAWQAASQDIYAQQQAQQGAQPGADAGQQSQSNAGGQQGGGDGQPEDVEFEEVK